MEEHLATFKREYPHANLGDSGVQIFLQKGHLIVRGVLDEATVKQAQGHIEYLQNKVCGGL